MVQLRLPQGSGGVADRQTLSKRRDCPGHGTEDRFGFKPILCGEDRTQGRRAEAVRGRRPPSFGERFELSPGEDRLYFQKSDRFPRRREFHSALTAKLPNWRDLRTTMMS